MYRLINENIKKILPKIRKDKDINEYDYLSNNNAQIGRPEYRGLYKKHWGMNIIQPSEEFCNVYFDLLRDTLNGNQQDINVEAIARKLYKTPVNNGRQKLQFSFSSKLVHMANPQLPIYDSLVANFYFFKGPNNPDWEKRLNQYMLFYNFLIKEYKRIIDKSLLNDPIQQFKDKFDAQNFTDQRIIDLLIWAFVKLLNKKSVMNGQVIYSYK